MCNKILVVEDHVPTMDSLRHNLQSQGYEVFATEYGKHALELVNKHRPHVIILDYELPDGFYGDKVLEHLRQNNDKTPVIFISNVKTEVEDRIIGLDNGADDYLIKPFDMGELLSRVSAICRRSSTIPHPIHCAFDLQSEVEIDGKQYSLKLNRISQQVWLNNEVRTPSSQAYKILYYLMIHYGEFIKRSELQKLVMGYEQEVLESNADFERIKEIRNALQLPGYPKELARNIWIENYKEYGYRFHREVSTL